MSNYVSTYSINFNEMKIAVKDSDFVGSSRWDHLIVEHEGSFSRDCQYMVFDYLGCRVEVGFDMVVSGKYEWDPGDYMTEPTSYTEIDGADIEITSLHIDQYEVELSAEITDILKKIIDKHL